MEDKFVSGLRGINKECVGQFINHEHFCEIKLLGTLFNHRNRTIRMYCPNNLKYNQMGWEECCDKCKHHRRFDLTDDGNHITNLIDRRT